MTDNQREAAVAETTVTGSDGTGRTRPALTLPVLATTGHAHDLLGSHQRRWASPARCRPYGGVVVKGQGLMAVMVGVAGSVWLPVLGAVRAFAGFATFSHAHIRGLAIPRLCSSHVRCLKTSASGPKGVDAQATDRGVCARAGNLGPPRQPATG
jgi:hypothetical protein